MAKSCPLLCDVTSSLVSVPNNSYLFFVPINIRSCCSGKWKCLVHINPDIIEAAYFFYLDSGHSSLYKVHFRTLSSIFNKMRFCRADSLVSCERFVQNKFRMKERDVGKRAHHGQLGQARVLNKREHWGERTCFARWEKEEKDWAEHALIKGETTGLELIP